MKTELQQTIHKINSAKNAGSFLNYIDYIRFPAYKNLEDNTRIDFDFPFTVFTGQNGSGKSSALHAIQGAPANQSPTKFWYSTQVDPINKTNSLIYGYKKDAKQIEVIKTRIQDLKYQKELDLWETSRPIIAYGMEKLPRGRRNPPIQKHVVYIDFRAELSAYDKYFYFSDLRRTKTIQSKQDYIRKYSWKLKEIIDHNITYSYRGYLKNDKPIALSQKELDAVSKILGKKYTECKIIKHSLFKNEGLTIYFKTDILGYSEAFAGRGEFAIVKIVSEVLNAPDYSLIILDEPEVSLHPGAQEQLKLFLLEQTLKKKLQVIVSSHSPEFVDSLPEKAIKLFYPTSNGTFTVKNNTHHIEAFSFIGVERNDQVNVYVEDDMVKILLERVLESLGGEYKLLFNIVYYPGGASAIYKRAATCSEEKDFRKVMILDGDQQKPKHDPGAITVADSKNFDKLNQLIFSSTKIDFNKLGFRIDSEGNDGGSLDQKTKAAFQFISFLWTNLYYLPNNSNPESLIWDLETANKLLAVKGVAKQQFNKAPKENFKDFIVLFYGDFEDNKIPTYKLFIDEFVKRKDDNYKYIVGILEEFKNSL